MIWQGRWRQCADLQKNNHPSQEHAIIRITLSNHFEWRWFQDIIRMISMLRNVVNIGWLLWWFFWAIWFVMVVFGYETTSSHLHEKYCDFLLWVRFWIPSSSKKVKFQETKNFFAQGPSALLVFESWKTRNQKQKTFLHKDRPNYRENRKFFEE